MFGALLAGAKALGSTLARTGIIRGTLGKVLGGTAVAAVGTAIGSSIPRMGAQPQFPQGLPQMDQAGMGMTLFRPGVGLVAAGGAAIARGVGGAVARTAGGAVVRQYGKKVMGLLAAGLLFEAGGKLWNAVTGQEYKQSRRMNYGNPKALRRGIRRVEGASKQYAKILRATVGGVKKCGYTVKPRKKGRSCG